MQYAELYKLLNTPQPLIKASTEQKEEKTQVFSESSCASSPTMAYNHSDDEVTSDEESEAGDINSQSSASRTPPSSTTLRHRLRNSPPKHSIVTTQY